MPKTETLSTSQVLTTPQACRLLRITSWMMVGGASWLFQRDEVEKLKFARYTRTKGGRS